MEAMIRCYDALMTEMGATRQLVIRTDGLKVENPAAAELAVDTIAAVAYGKYYPEMWIQLPYDQKDATVGNGTVQVAGRGQTGVPSGVGAWCDRQRPAGAAGGDDDVAMSVVM